VDTEKSSPFIPGLWELKQNYFHNPRIEANSKCQNKLFIIQVVSFLSANLECSIRLSQKLKSIWSLIRRTAVTTIRRVSHRIVQWRIDD
jgi:hypothetical protein